MAKTGSEVKGVKIFNAIRTNSSEAFMNVVPAATPDNIQTLSNILFGDEYAPQLNEFVHTLINRIALTIVRNKSFNNPLAILKKGSIPLGTDIQDLYTNPAEAEDYEYSNTAMAKLLTITDPDTKVAYYRRNRQDMYTKTISREGLQGAFVSWNKFNDYIATITNSLYSGNYIDEFKYTKMLIDGAYDNNKAIIQTVTDVTDENSAREFVRTARALYKKMKFPSTEYNAYSKMSGDAGTITTWTDEDRVLLIVTADVMKYVDVDVLARAFNIDNSKFLGRVIEIDKFENPEIKAIICDEAFFQIYDNIFRFDEFYNARTMTWNEYLHAWGTYAICPFANAVILATAEPVPATALTFNEENVSIIGVGTEEGLEITVTPQNSTSDIEYTSSNPLVFTVIKVDNKNSKLTATGLGEATLTAKTDNGLTATTKVTVTAG